MAIPLFTFKILNRTQEIVLISTAMTGGVLSIIESLIFIINPILYYIHILWDGIGLTSVTISYKGLSQKRIRIRFWDRLG
jgi:hypothetical protein